MKKDPSHGSNGQVAVCRDVKTSSSLNITRVKRLYGSLNLACGFTSPSKEQQQQAMLAMEMVTLPEAFHHRDSSSFSPSSCTRTHKWTSHKNETRSISYRMAPSLPSSSFQTTIRRKANLICSARSPESLYEVLGISPAATERDIKQAYRKLALKYHPDVNKEPDAQERFMRVKKAYQTLVDPRERSKYNASIQYADIWGKYRWESAASSKNDLKKEEEFYGLEDFIRDLQADLQKRETSPKPKSLWEELAEIGEEFVEFLEKELNIVDDNSGKPIQKQENIYDFDLKQATQTGSKNKMEQGSQGDWNTRVQNDVNEIEDMLAQLKKELDL